MQGVMGLRHPAPSLASVLVQSFTATDNLASAGLECSLSTVNEGAKMGMLKAVLVFLRAMLIPKIHLAVENLALR